MRLTLLKISNKGDPCSGCFLADLSRVGTGWVPPCTKELVAEGASMELSQLKLICWTVRLVPSDYCEPG
jgi:hypothetical protein